MKRNGFTLVELLAVIILLGILMAIAVPSALSINNKVKEQSYGTKIDIMEQAGITYGQKNLNYIKRGINLNDVLKSGSYCTFTYDEANENIKSVKYVMGTTYETTTLPSDDRSFWCVRAPIKTLVDTGDLDWDEKDRCTDCGDEYKNIVVNPVSDAIINECYMYIYYKYTRVYAYFDKATCDKRVENYSEAVNNGYQYSKNKS